MLLKENLIITPKVGPTDPIRICLFLEVQKYKQETFQEVQENKNQMKIYFYY